MDKLYEYAWRILTDAGCDEYTYGGEFAAHLMDHLKDAFPNGMDYPYIDVANAILAISRPHPIERAPYRMAWDTDNCCDTIPRDSFESAKADAEDTLINWASDEMSGWDAENGPTEDQIKSWNYMIFNCGVQVERYDPATDEYDVVYSFSDQELHDMGWDEYEKLDWPWTKGE